jgi:hypothetical protein
MQVMHDMKISPFVNVLFNHHEVQCQKVKGVFNAKTWNSCEMWVKE